MNKINLLKPIHYIFVLLFSISFTCLGQKDAAKFGHDAYKAGDFFSAAYYFQKAMEQDPDNIDIAYWLADASRLSYAYIDAEKWYNYVMNKTPQNTYPLINFYLGSVYKSLGKYEEALNLYQTYVNDFPETSNINLPKAKQEISSCIKAIQILKDTLENEVTRISNSINTPYSEFNPYPLGDSVLYFSSLRATSQEKPNALIPPSYTTMIYKSNLNMGGWSEPKEIDSKININDAHNANMTFNDTKDIMYFSRCYEDTPSKMSCKLFRTKLDNNKWSLPEKLNPNINLPGYTSTQPSYGKSKDGQEVLFFVSDRPGGQGGLDLWYAVIKNDILNAPINIGSFINTQGDEITPHYHIPSQSLYFSSDWLEGLGGFDIFKSKGFFNEWEKPENLGYPINTSFNDIYFVLNDEFPEAFLTSNRPGSLHLKGETCCNDLYYVKYKEPLKDTLIELVEIIDTVPVTIKEKIEELLPLTLYFHNDEPDPATTKTTTELSYETTLEAYTKLKEIYRKEYAEGLSGKEKTQAENDIMEFFDSYVMNGFDKLKRFSAWLTQDLEAGNTVQITIRGYCSPLNRGTYNVNLSKRRISSLVNYIKTFDNGKLLKYLNHTAENGGKLDIFEEPLGDMQSAPFVSNNPNDVRNSIYSRAAALERKVEIVMYNSGQDSTDFNFPELSFRNPYQDFGMLKKDEKKTHIFIFRNTGKSPLLITSVETTSSAITTDWEAKEIPPAGTGVINILFDAKNLKGNFTENIYVTANTNQGKIILEIKAYIE